MIWMYTFEDEEAARDFVCDVVSGWEWDYVRDGCTVVTDAAPDELRADTINYMGFPAEKISGVRLVPTRGILLDMLAHAKTLGFEEKHVMADLLLLAYLNDPQITEAFLAISRCYS